MYKLSIEGLHKKYGNHEVLKGVSLQAKAGDVISIIGSSGSGKSTFLRCFNFLEQPCACGGQIHASCKKSAPSWPWCFSISICGNT